MGADQREGEVNFLEKPFLFEERKLLSGSFPTGKKSELEAIPSAQTLPLDLSATGCGWQWPSVILKPKKVRVILILGAGDIKWDDRNLGW